MDVIFQMIENKMSSFLLTANFENILLQIRIFICLIILRQTKENIFPSHVIFNSAHVLVIFLFLLLVLLLCESGKKERYV
jgi:hypothetical protein